MHELTISSVLLEGPSKHGDLLASDAKESARSTVRMVISLRVEEGLDNLSRESVLLVLVLPLAMLTEDMTHHLDDCSPVLGDLG